MHVNKDYFQSETFHANIYDEKTDYIQVISQSRLTESTASSYRYANPVLHIVDSSLDLFFQTNGLVKCIVVCNGETQSKNEQADQNHKRARKKQRD